MNTNYCQFRLTQFPFECQHNNNFHENLLNFAMSADVLLIFCCKKKRLETVTLEWKPKSSTFQTYIAVEWFIGRRVNCLEVMETYRKHIFLVLFTLSHSLRVFSSTNVGVTVCNWVELSCANGSSLSNPDTIILKDSLIYVHFSLNVLNEPRSHSNNFRCCIFTLRYCQRFNRARDSKRSHHWKSSRTAKSSVK